MKYTKAQFDQDKFLVKLAQSRLSARVAGLSGVELQQYRDMYFEIAKKFEPDSTMRRIIDRMFIDLMVDGPMGGFKCLEYERLLKLVLKKLGSLMFFRRKKKITCFFPKEHKQPCYCARKEAMDAARVEPLPDAEDQAARVNGILNLEAQQV